MPSLFQTTNETRLRLTRWALLGLFACLGLLHLFQARMVLKYSVAGRPSAGSLAETMQVRFNGISLAIMSYLEMHDALSLERIKSEGQQASQMLEKMKAEALVQGNSAAYAPIERAHNEMRMATFDLLEADHAQRHAEEALSVSGQALMSIMIARLEPSIRANQLNSSARLRSILAAGAEARSVAKSPVDTAGLSASQKRFHLAMERYAQLSQTSRAARWADEAIALFDQCSRQARELQQVQESKQVALDRYTQKHSVFDIVFQESRSIPNPRSQIFTARQLFSSDLGSVALGGVLLLLGVVMVLLMGGAARPTAPADLEYILQCAEAAARGDVSRLPQPEVDGSTGPLAQAVARLITVLARSENLVYHLAALVEASGDAIVSFTLDGTILSWNKGAQRIYGYSAEELKGQPIALLSPQDNGIEMIQVLQRIRNGERVQPFETIHQARNGRTVRAFIRISAILGSTRQAIGASFCAQELIDRPPVPAKSISDSKIV